MELEGDAKRIITGADEQFLVCSEAGWAVVGVGTLARFREDTAHDGESRVDALWHLPQTGVSGVGVREPVPALLVRGSSSTQADEQGFPSYRHSVLEVVPESTGEPVASAHYSIDLRN